MSIKFKKIITLTVEHFGIKFLFFFLLGTNGEAVQQSVHVPQTQCSDHTYAGAVVANSPAPSAGIVSKSDGKHVYCLPFLQDIILWFSGQFLYSRFEIFLSLSLQL